MGARGRRIVEERFAVDRVAALHEDLYTQLGRASGANRCLTKETW
jgi:hypothetical protein